MDLQREEKIVGFYRRLADPIVDFIPDFDVRARQVVDTSDRFTLLVTAHAQDHPKLIGTGGRIINAFKLLLAIYGLRLGCKIEIVQNRPIVGERGEWSGFQANENWKPDFTIKILQDTAKDLFVFKTVVTLQEATPRTLFKLLVDPREQLPALSSEREGLLTWQTLQQAFEHVFNMIGRAQGRLVNIDILHGANETKHDPRTTARAAKAPG